MHDSFKVDTQKRLLRARAAQLAWARFEPADRLKIIRRLRDLIAAQSTELTRVVGAQRKRSAAEILTNEIIPLADACRFLERDAPRLLRARQLGRRGRPAWLFGVRAEIWREPLGVVLILAPSNYPLFLAGVQALQALVAGNAVLVKPAPGGMPVSLKLRGLLAAAGLPEGLYQVLDEDVRSAQALIAAGVDKVVLTGSAATGRRLLADLAPCLIPATLELSGCDAMFVLPGASLAMVASAIVFGLRLNGGATCIAPRRVFVPRDLLPALERHLLPLAAQLPAVPFATTARERIIDPLREAETQGARASTPLPTATDTDMTPVVIVDARPECELLKADIFAPIIALVAVDRPQEALELDAWCPYALGASVFGPEPAALAFATRIRAGSIVINDLIVPTADPRLSFGGRDESGYGVTRGVAGLLEFTRIKTVSTRRGQSRPHYQPSHADDPGLFTAYLKAAHAISWRKRLRALARVLIGLLKRG
jgi:acyl-CoA reductase-like NAD-dependent aldehyde dehydrogenase